MTIQNSRPTKILLHYSGEIAKIKTAQNPQLAPRDIVKSPNTRGEFKNILSQFFGTTEGVAYKYLNNIDEVQRFQNLIVSSIDRSETLNLFENIQVLLNLSVRQMLFHFI